MSIRLMWLPSVLWIAEAVAGLFAIFWVKSQFHRAALWYGIRTWVIGRFRMNVDLYAWNIYSFCPHSKQKLDNKSDHFRAAKVVFIVNGTTIARAIASIYVCILQLCWHDQPTTPLVHHFRRPRHVSLLFDRYGATLLGFTKMYTTNRTSPMGRLSSHVSWFVEVILIRSHARICWVVVKNSGWFYDVIMNS